MRRVFVAGHRGMVGSAILRELSKDRTIELVLAEKSQLNLTDQAKVQLFFKTNRIDEVYLAAAKVGGIHANNCYPFEFIYDNLMIQNNVIHAAFKSGVKKLLFLGSSCIYPRDANQPMSEAELLSGPLEPTNEPYALAKIAGIKLCESLNRQYGDSTGVDYRSVMPTNLYGPRDNYHPMNSHVIPGLIRRFHEAKVNRHKAVVIWGSGRQRREFLFVDDMARASVFLMNQERDRLSSLIDSRRSHINVGYGSDIAISELAKIIAGVVGFRGCIEFDTTRPDGPAKKLISSELINSLGWKPAITLADGIELAYLDFLDAGGAKIVD